MSVLSYVLLGAIGFVATAPVALGKRLKYARRTQTRPVRETKKPATAKWRKPRIEIFEDRH